MASEDSAAPAPDQGHVAAGAGAQAAGKASAKGKRAVRPKIDLDEEIRQANALAAMSRKMLNAARSSSRNNRKAKQRLIRKAGKLSPEDLERIAVLKRCGLFEEDAEEGEDNGGEEEKTAATKRDISGASSSSGNKKPKLQSTLQSLAEANPILEEIGVANFGKSGSASGSSSAAGSKSSDRTKTGPVVLGARARLSRGRSDVSLEKDTIPAAVPE